MGGILIRDEKFTGSKNDHAMSYILEYRYLCTCPRLLCINARVKRGDRRLDTPDSGRSQSKCELAPSFHAPRKVSICTE